MAKTRDYLFYDTAVSLCGTCFRRIDAKIVCDYSSTCRFKAQSGERNWVRSFV